MQSQPSLLFFPIFSIHFLFKIAAFFPPSIHNVKDPVERNGFFCVTQKVSGPHTGTTGKRIWILVPSSSYTGSIVSAASLIYDQQGAPSTHGLVSLARWSLAVLVRGAGRSPSPHSQHKREHRHSQQPESTHRNIHCHCFIVINEKMDTPIIPPAKNIKPQCHFPLHSQDQIFLTSLLISMLSLF